jgi:drug/metabolite transporter (DMT)-like permease
LPTILQAILVPFCWSLVFPLSKLIMRDLPPLTISALRYLLGALFLTLFALAAGERREMERLVRTSWPGLLALGLLATASNATEVYGLRWASSAIGAIIGAASPVVSAWMAAQLLHERLSPNLIVGLVASLAGVSVIAISGPADGTVTSVLGVILIAAGAITYSGYTILGKRYAAQSLSVLAVSTWLGALPLALVAFAAERPWAAIAAARPVSWLALLALAALPTAVAVIWFFSLVARVGAARASLILYLMPVFGLAQSRVLLGEKLTPALLIGGLATIGGVAFAEFGAAARKLKLSDQRPG